MTALASLAGYRMPAEWEPHAGTWIAWPHAAGDWPGKFPPIPWVYAEIVRALAAAETVNVLVEDAKAEAAVLRNLQRAGAAVENVRLHRVPTNRTWMRDFGPVFVRRGGSRAVAGFRFNAWARYPDFALDAKVSARAARIAGVPHVPVSAGGKPFVLEGGSIDVNGRGSLLTTEECLLDREVQGRNPHLDRAGIEAALAGSLGATNVLWLGRGIAGDDTHGHVDDLCRFVAPGRVVLCRTPDARDENYGALEENRERVEGFRAEDGSRIERVDLPMPRPVVFSGQRLPASYANFYVANSLVIVPTFNDPNDRLALGILSACFPGREVVGIHAVDLVWGLGTLHCLTQQEPALPA